LLLDPLVTMGGGASGRCGLLPALPLVLVLVLAAAGWLSGSGATGDMEAPSSSV
jgi:hypothetical protein